MQTEPLFTNDAIVFGILMLCLGIVFFTENKKTGFFPKFYKYVPALLMCYFLPAIFSSVGIISPESSQTYFIASRYLLPASLVLMTLSIDLKAIFKLGPKALIETLAELANSTAKAIAQDESLANYAHKLSKQEADIDWSMDAEQIERNIRSFNPWPVCFTQMSGNTVKIYQAKVVKLTGEPGTVLASDKTGITIATGKNSIKIEQLQPQGKKPMSAQDFLNGRADWVEINSVIGNKGENE